MKIIRKYTLLFKKIISLMRLNNDELNFVEKNSVECCQKKVIVVEVPIDYYYLIAFDKAIKSLEAKHGLMRKIGVWPYSILPVGRTTIIKESIIHVYSLITYFLLKNKWRRLYSAIGVDSVITQTSVNRITRKKCNIHSSKIFNSIKTKNNVLDIEYRGIYLGDLVYDTYLRFRNQPTVDIDDVFLKKIIFTAIISVEKALIFFKEAGVEYYLTSYTSYIHHGIFTRVALFYNINVYSQGNNSQYFKKLSLSDNSHTVAYKDYFTKSRQLNKNLEYVDKILIERFSGGIDNSTLYMRKSAFHSDSECFSGVYDGVIFLHDFFDSPHCWGDMLFVDFWEWVCFTFDIIEENKLNIAAKLHPNRIEDGDVVVKLKALYPSIKWIDSNISNKLIFSSGIVFGVSVYGSVLPELVYYGINAISAGDNPTSSFDFVHSAKSKEEYKRLLINGAKLKVCNEHKREVLSFYYMHTESHNDGICTNLDKTELKVGIDYDSSVLNLNYD